MPFQDLRKGVWLVACPRQDPCVPGCGEQRTGIQLGWPSRCVHFADGKTNLVVVSSALRSQCTPPPQRPFPGAGSQPQPCWLSSVGHEHFISPP